jgi:hypothetical protein
VARLETVLAVRVPTPVARELKRQARADDRPLSSYLRLMLTRAAGSTAGAPTATTSEPGA